MSMVWRWVLCALVFVLAAAEVPAAADMAEVRRAMAEQRYFDAFTDLQQLAADGDPEAQFELAGFHHYGRVGPVNFEKAFNWYSRSANQGNADAMIGLAVLYGQGQGMERNPQLAYQWLATAKFMPMPPEVESGVTNAMAGLRTELSDEQVLSADAIAKAFSPKLE